MDVPVECMQQKLLTNGLEQNDSSNKNSTVLFGVSPCPDSDKSVLRTRVEITYLESEHRAVVSLSFFCE
jgi:hypothetical protein